MLVALYVVLLLNNTLINLMGLCFIYLFYTFFIGCTSVYTNTVYYYHIEIYSKFQWYFSEKLLLN